MKYFFVLTFCLIAGCSMPVSPYSPGGQYYMAPGTFVGTWEPMTVNGNFVDTNVCTAVITEADSVVIGSITNDSTKEVIQINGVHNSFSFADDRYGPDNHQYWIRYVSSSGDTGSSGLDFSTGNSLNISCESGQFDVWIDCNRQ
jgi:hypothetical protein